MTSDLILYQFSRERGEACDAKDFYWRFASLRNGTMVSPWCMTVHDNSISSTLQNDAKAPPIPFAKKPGFTKIFG
jgi:hypothetical protein